MGRTFRIDIHTDLPDSFVRLLATLTWGVPDYRGKNLDKWNSPYRIVYADEITISSWNSLAGGVSAEDWIRAMKYAMGFYEALRREGVSASLLQYCPSVPPGIRTIAKEGGDPDLTRLCKAPLWEEEEA